MKTISISLTLLLLLFLPAQSANADMAQQMQNHIESMLIKLKQRPAGSFLIIETKKSGNFIQFAGSSSEGLLFDMPLSQLTPDQHARLVKFLNKRSFAYPQSGVLNKQFGKDTRRASKYAKNILYEVFDIAKPKGIQGKWGN